MKKVITILFAVVVMLAAFTGCKGNNISGKDNISSTDSVSTTDSISSTDGAATTDSISSTDGAATTNSASDTSSATDSQDQGGSALTGSTDANILDGGYVTQAGSKIYIGTDGYLLSSDINGNTQKTSLSDSSGSYSPKNLIINNNTIYFMDEKTYKIMKMGLDGKNIQAVTGAMDSTPGELIKFYIANGYIYYLADVDGYVCDLSRVGLDSTESNMTGQQNILQNIHDAVVDPDSGRIFYAPAGSDNYSRSVNSCDLDGNDVKILVPGQQGNNYLKIMEQSWGEIMICGDRVIYTYFTTAQNAGENDLISMNKDGSDPKTLLTNFAGAGGPFGTVINDTIYCNISAPGTNALPLNLYAVKADGSADPTLITGKYGDAVNDTSINYIESAGGKLLLSVQGTGWVMMDTDGSNEKNLQ